AAESSTATGLRFSVVGVTAIVKVCGALVSTPPFATPPSSCAVTPMTAVPLAFGASVNVNVPDGAATRPARLEPAVADTDPTKENAPVVGSIRTRNPPSVAGGTARTVPPNNVPSGMKCRLAIPADGAPPLVPTYEATNVAAPVAGSILYRPGAPARPRAVCVPHS